MHDKESHYSTRLQGEYIRTKQVSDLIIYSSYIFYFRNDNYYSGKEEK